MTLADGRKVTALVPQVYLVARDSDITSHGAVISANQIIGNVHTVDNSGVIAGRDVARLNSYEVQNRGTIAANVVDIATERFHQLGGKTQAVENLTVFANQSLEIESTLSNATSRDGNFSRAMLDKTSSLSVTGKNGEMNLLSNGDITVKAANLESEGKVTIDGNRVNITTLQTHNKEHYNGDADNYYRLDQKAEVGSSISGKTGVSVVSDTDNTLRQASLSSENGLVEVGSRKGNVTIEAGRAEEQLATSSKSTSRGLLSKTTTINRHYHDNREAVGSNLEGEQVHVWSNNGDVLVKASNILGDKEVEIDAKNNATITADTNYFKEVNQTERKKSGLMGSGGIGFTIGKKSEKHEYESEGWTQSDARSVVGSQQGNIRISAGNHAQVTGTDLITPRTQRVDILGATTKVEAGKDIIETKENHEYKQSGFTLALSSSVTDAVMDARQSVRRADEVKSDKLKALYAMKAADDAYRAVEATGELSKTLNSLMDGTMQNNGAGENPSVKLSVSYGSQKTVERKSGKEITHSKSNISTGELNVKARDGKAVFEGVDAEANTIRLAGKQGIEVKGVKDEKHQRTENKSSGGSVGVFVGASNGSYGFGVEGSVNVAKGKSNLDSEHWQNSVFNADKIITDSEEGGLTLDAANFKTKRWEGDIQNLTLTSRQDTEKYSSKQTSAKASGSVAWGSGGSASVAASYSKAKVDYAQVNQQTGIDVGEGGMNVTVHNHSQIDGAFIDSKADAENNRFKTKSIGYSNIENHSEIKTESASVSAGSGGINPMQAISSALSLLGNGNESATSQTKAAIGQNIQIETDTPENLQGLSRDVANANQQVQKQSLEKMQERQEMAKVIGELADSGLRRLTEKSLKEAAAKRQQAEAIAKENPTQAEALKAEAKAIEAEYGLGSDLQMGVRAATAALQGLATNDINQAIVGAASPYLNQEIKNRTTNADGTVNTQANLIAHALLGAAEAKVTGNNALAGATAAFTAEAAAPYIMQVLYQTDNPAELSETQKRNIADLSQIAAGLSGGLVGDSTQNAVAGAEIGKRAVENNHLGSQKYRNNLEDRAKKGDLKAQKMLEIEKKLKAVGIVDVEELIQEYKACNGCEEAKDKYTLAREQALSVLADLVFSGELTKEDVSIITSESSNKAKNIERGNPIGNAEVMGQAYVYDYLPKLVMEKEGVTLSPLEQFVADIMSDPTAFSNGGGTGKSLKNRVNKTALYDSKTMRKDVENKYGSENVTSTTVPPEVNTKNTRLAGTRHPITGVPFDNKGFPIFDNIVKHDTRLNINEFRNSSYTEQMKMATRKMYAELGDIGIKKNFNKVQIEAIRTGQAKIPGYTWHHHQDTGRMQLVPEWEHSKTGHVGGEYIHKGK